MCISSLRMWTFRCSYPSYVTETTVFWKPLPMHFSFHTRTKAQPSSKFTLFSLPQYYCSYPLSFSYIQESVEVDSLYSWISSLQHPKESKHSSKPRHNGIVLKHCILGPHYHHSYILCQNGEILRNMPVKSQVQFHASYKMQPLSPNTGSPISVFDGIQLLFLKNKPS